MADYTVCPDDHKCENGSLCVENPRSEGKFFCDCDEATGYDSVFAGLYCQHRATVYCTLTGEISRSTFCTNEGTCKAIVDDFEAHMGCDCPKGYEGQHCQYVEGTQPADWPAHNPGYQNSQSNSKGFNGNAAIESGIAPGAVFGVVFSILVVLGISMFFMTRRNNATALSCNVPTDHVIDHTKSTDGHLHNPDGESLNNVVRPNTTPTFDSDVYMTDNNDHHHHETGPQLT